MIPSRLLATALLLALAAPATAEPPLQALGRDLVGPDQGVYARAEDGTVLVSVVADRAVHPASVTKVATTLALLRRLGPDHRFATRLAAAGPVAGGVLRGDLVVEAEGDPFLVDESGFTMLLELRQHGIQVVGGGFVVRGPLLFDWQPDPGGQRLRRVLEGRAGQAAWPAVRAAHAGVAASPQAVGLRFEDRRLAPAATSAPLVVHRSPPLVRIVKSFNCWSNNAFHLVSDRIGGPAVVQQLARESVAPEMRDEIIIENGAGAGTVNRLSPRAAVALLDALDAEVRGEGRQLTDVLPVTRLDLGTLHDRLAPGLVAGKTGTFGSVGASALAGVLRTQRYGKVTFAVLNHDVPVPDARRRQDAFVEALARATGAVPWEYHPVPLPSFGEAKVASTE